MREIKFRVWDGEEMRDVDLYWFEENGVRAIPEDLPDGCTVMEYLVFHDKHGSKVCEGDILSIEGATAKVVFWERPPEFGLDFAHNEDRWCEDWNITDDSGRMEVIGNVYQHPHLLH